MGRSGSPHITIMKLNQVTGQLNKRFSPSELGVAISWQRQPLREGRVNGNPVGKGILTAINAHFHAAGWLGWGVRRVVAGFTPTDKYHPKFDFNLNIRIKVLNIFLKRFFHSKINPE
jgi:hypothetical protein